MLVWCCRLSNITPSVYTSFRDFLMEANSILTWRCSRPVGMCGTPNNAHNARDLNIRSQRPAIEKYSPAALPLLSSSPSYISARGPSRRGIHILIFDWKCWEISAATIVLLSLSTWRIRDLGHSFPFNCSNENSFRKVTWILYMFKLEALPGTDILFISGPAEPAHSSCHGGHSTVKSAGHLSCQVTCQVVPNSWHCHSY